MKLISALGVHAKRSLTFKVKFSSNACPCPTVQNHTLRTYFVIIVVKNTTFLCDRQHYGLCNVEDASNYYFFSSVQSNFRILNDVISKTTANLNREWQTNDTLRTLINDLCRIIDFQFRNKFDLRLVSLFIVCWT